MALPQLSNTETHFAPSKEDPSINRICTRILSLENSTLNRAAIVVTIFLLFRKSRKNRRKSSHRRWSLKEGSSHEDLALMEAISDLCTTVDSLQGKEEREGRRRGWRREGEREIREL